MRWFYLLLKNIYSRVLFCFLKSLFIELRCGLVFKVFVEYILDFEVNFSIV